MKVLIVVAVLVVIGLIIYWITRVSAHANRSEIAQVTLRFELPDKGEPGSATTRQKAAVATLGFERDFANQLSSEQAHVLLSARNYVEAVLDRHWDENHDHRHPYEAVRKGLMSIIVNEPALRDYVTAWSDREYRSGRDEPQLPRSPEHEQILAAYRELT